MASGSKGRSALTTAGTADSWGATAGTADSWGVTAGTADSWGVTAGTADSWGATAGTADSWGVTAGTADSWGVTAGTAGTGAGIEMGLVMGCGFCILAGNGGEGRGMFCSISILLDGT